MTGVLCLCLGEEEYIRIIFSLSCYDCRAVRVCVQLSLTFWLAEFMCVLFAVYRTVGSYCGRYAFFFNSDTFSYPRRIWQKLRFSNQSSFTLSFIYLISQNGKFPSLQEPSSNRQHG